MNNHNFTLVNADTDSISISKPDGSPFSQQEMDSLLKEINSLSPEQISWENDGLYSTVIAFKAKNYILYDSKKITYKGSAIKASTKEKALQQMIKDIIQAIIDNKDLLPIYNQYILEALNVTDINRWSSRKTITDKVLNPERLNESKVFDALEGQDIQEGDRRYFYFKSDNTLALAENFDGDYNKVKLLEKIYKTIVIFKDVVDINQFKKYHLKKGQKLLKEDFGIELSNYDPKDVHN